MCTCFFVQRSKEEEQEIFDLAKFIGDYNIRRGSIDARFLPYVREVAAAIYDAGYRKIAVPKDQAIVCGSEAFYPDQSHNRKDGT